MRVLSFSLAIVFLVAGGPLSGRCARAQAQPARASCCCGPHAHDRSAAERTQASFERSCGCVIKQPSDAPRSAPAVERPSRELADAPADVLAIAVVRMPRPIARLVDGLAHGRAPPAATLVEQHALLLC